MSNRFKIQGPYSEDDQAYLYWSNDIGWVDFDSATIFNKNELNQNYPMESTRIVLLGKHGEITQTVEIKDLC